MSAVYREGDAIMSAAYFNGHAYREVFEQVCHDPGRVYYTIIRRDVGRRVLHTEVGPIDVSVILGEVLIEDVGRRLYRVPMQDGSGWLWQAESTVLRDRRTSDRARDGRVLFGGTATNDELRQALDSDTSGRQGS